jgi:hypothetical protein
MLRKNINYFHKINFPLKHFIYTLLFLASTVALIIYLPPTYQISIIYLKVPIIIPFFIIIFLLFYSLGMLLFGRKKHALIIASFVVLYLLFRLNNLTQPLFLILLLALFLVAEFLFTRRDNK